MLRRLVERFLKRKSTNGNTRLKIKKASLIMSSDPNEPLIRAIVKDIKNMEPTKFETGTFINEAERRIIIHIYDDGSPDSLKLAVGELCCALDIAKQTISQWHFKNRQTKGIIVSPQANGKGPTHVV